MHEAHLRMFQLDNLRKIEQFSLASFIEGCPRDTFAQVQIQPDPRALLLQARQQFSELKTAINNAIIKVPHLPRLQLVVEKGPQLATSRKAKEKTADPPDPPLPC